MIEIRMNARDFRDHVGQRIDAAHHANAATVVAKNGRDRAVLIPHSWWTEWVRDEQSRREDQAGQGGVP